MGIFGIGTDIVKVSRIKKLIINKKFLKRLFNKDEIKKCSKSKNTSSCYAKRFAAKEAAAKALGTGFRKGVFWKDLEINNFPSGEPTVIFHGKSKQHLNRMISGAKQNVKLTITDEYPYAQAIVIING